ncbi:MAG: hypothetical protein VKL98_06755, partial [Cyanobacteriota bacterium]|nr:hypothetical protein [Cyanobacteriota bacterium]
STDGIVLDLGLTYQPIDNLGLTARWQHIFLANTDINRTVPGAGSLVGSYSTGVDTLSLMLEYNF